MTEITASVEPGPKDERPEPPSEIGETFAVSYWYWSDISYKWKPATEGFDTLVEATKYAQQCLTLGSRGIRIVTIPGGKT